VTDDLLSNLRKSSKRWATLITQEATKNLGKFGELIKVKSKTIENGGKLEIVSTGIATNKDKPVARAYEYGSGTRSRSTKTSPKQQGSRGFIRIAPKRKKVLAFFWDKVDENTPAGEKFLGVSTKTGKALFAYVDHPGVQAANNGKGYLAPAIAKVRRQIRKEIKPDVRKAVLGSFKKSFRVSKK
jgi:hypothetical protein